MLSFIFFASFSLLFTGCAHVTKNKHSVKIYPVESGPLIGLTESAQTVYLGGFSSLNFTSQKDDIWLFETITDRGPNGSENSLSHRPFLLPDFAPQLVSLGFNVKSGEVKVLRTQPFWKIRQKKMNGLPPPPAPGQKTERPSNIYGRLIAGSTDGMDSEGFCRTGEHIVVAEEYGPDLLIFNEELILQKRLRPGAGLPAELSLRKNNRGFEALACDKDRAYVMLQSPLQTDEPKDKGHIRLIEFDLKKYTVLRQYLYPLSETKADKIGDMTLLPDGSLLIMEQNGVLGSSGVRRIYKVSPRDVGEDSVLRKVLMIDLAQKGLNDFEKLEGLTVIDRQTLGVIMDNDFGLSGELDSSTGLATFRKDTKSYLMIIKTQSDLFD
jgi:hypothetical protein